MTDSIKKSTAPKSRAPQSATVEKRREQNRLAGARLRAKKEAYRQGLEDKVTVLTTQGETLQAERVQLTGRILSLRRQLFAEHMRLMPADAAPPHRMASEPPRAPAPTARLQTVPPQEPTMTRAQRLDEATRALQVQFAEAQAWREFTPRTRPLSPEPQTVCPRDVFSAN